MADGVARLKPSSTPGVLNSMFTKDWENMKTAEKNDGDKGEVDLELLTYTFGQKTGKAHIAIHTKSKSNVFYADVPLDFNPSDDFHEWGFDVLPDRVVWHVDGRFLGPVALHRGVPHRARLRDVLQLVDEPEVDQGPGEGTGRLPHRLGEVLSRQGEGEGGGVTSVGTGVG